MSFNGGTTIDCIARLEEIQSIAVGLGYNFPMPTLSLEYFAEQRQAGVYSFRTRTLWLNPVLAHHHSQYYTDVVMPHEAAHLIQLNNGLYHGGDIHDGVWESLCTQLGAPIIPQHDLPMELYPEYASPARAHVYVCGCPDHKRYHFVGNRRHKLYQQKTDMTTECSACNSPVVFSHTMNYWD